MFQSSPAPRRGRYGSPERGRPERSSFNPRPHRGAGATCIAFEMDLAIRFQSSPAPRRGRYCSSRTQAQRPLCFNPRPHRGAGATGINTIPWSARTRFNPRPHRGAGATGIPSDTSRMISVSILARTEARALRRLGYNGWHTYRFQSSPAPRRGRYREGL